jgi:ribosome-binding ATPase YchF (GTP1/OBG family)
MKTIGFCGLPNAGKSTFLKLLTQTETLISNYPFTTLTPKLAKGFFISDNLSQLYAQTKTAKLIPSYLNFLDVPGLIKGSHKGLGLGNEFLSYLRQADYILEIVRNFKREDVIHSEGYLDPERDVLLIEEEIILADKKIIEDNLRQLTKRKNDQEKNKIEKLEYLLSKIEPFKRFPELADDLKEYNLLLTKEWFLIFNGDLDVDLKKFSSLGFRKVFQLDFQFELELQENSDLQKEIPSQLNIFLNDLRHALCLIEVFTFTEEITQSWLVDKDSLIINFAFQIHTDFGQKFKYGEVVSLDNFLLLPNWSLLKSKGLIKQVGKDYHLQEAEIVKIII